MVKGDKRRLAFQDGEGKKRGRGGRGGRGGGGGGRDYQFVGSEVEEGWEAIEGGV
jgi:hypothetical protein